MMEFSALVLRLCLIDIKRLLLIMTITIAVIIIFQGVISPYDQSFLVSQAHQERGSIAVAGGNLTILNATESAVNLILPPGLDKKDHVDNEEEFLEESDAMEGTCLDSDMESDNLTGTVYMGEESTLTKKLGTNGLISTDYAPISTELDQRVNLSVFEAATTMSLESSFDVIGQNKTINAEKTETIHVETKRRSSKVNSRYALKRLNGPALSISDMNLLLVKSSVSSKPMTGKKRPSARDQELLSAKLEIKKAPVANDTQGLQRFVYQNISQFIRSYELMERILKVYVYKEGEKPIFHQPKARGIYASEGWFMKLMEGNKKFLVRDPRKAHLFYLPVSSLMLRAAIDDHNFKSHRDLMKYIKSYIDLISHKYRFWNRTKGADHFLVACHDWATRTTPQEITGNSIRSLCNSNAAKGFQIGKDTTLPVTYVRSVEEPTRDLGGKLPSERSILAFFAGSMHGYLRPLLLHHWENKQPNMKIFGSLPRDLAGKKTYREYMKSSKFCICARGYEVHTPRVVEAVFYECVPVIISDNYVPPFFEVLKWEEFAVFVKEKDVPNLGRILSSISEEKYLRLQLGVKAVQRHFIWHKKPVKFDLFHMVLHSVWHIRMLRLKQR